jgi:hypothetical protein
MSPYKQQLQHGNNLTICKKKYRIHKLPIEIMSKRDLNFVGTWWTMLFKTLGTKLCFSIATTLNQMLIKKGLIEP